MKVCGEKCKTRENVKSAFIDRIVIQSFNPRLHGCFHTKRSVYDVNSSDYESREIKLKTPPSLAQLRQLRGLFHIVVRIFSE